ncbi:hypothetical protein KSP39_PZI006134 [Platanthera zijinensis]|uniref:SWIM-type domain-containing protein n=1 Tax=Platanthera zijinensis TaxID=2320716 RepID=A0AAP0BUK5_9ASPA
MGFSVRKNYTNKSKIDKQITSIRYLCSKNGHRRKDKCDHLTKKPRPDTRTDCHSRMGIMLNREIGKYYVHDFVPEHNHLLHVPAFERFQDEWEKSLGICVKQRNELGTTHEYLVASYDEASEYKVIGDLSNQTVSCNCKKFETFGILCSHALKVLDAMDIKLIPEIYIMKRWTRGAKEENLGSTTIDVEVYSIFFIYFSSLIILVLLKFILSYLRGLQT